MRGWRGAAALLAAVAVAAPLGAAQAGTSDVDDHLGDGEVTIFKRPTKAYLDGLCKIDTSDPDHTMVRTLPMVGDGCEGRSVSFSSTHETLSVPKSWPTWSGPPHTESSTPDVLLGRDEKVSTTRFSTPTVRAGMEVQAGDLHGRRTVTVVFRDEKGSEIATVVRKLREPGEARLFAIEADVPIGSMEASIAGRKPKVRHDTVKNSIGNIR